MDEYERANRAAELRAAIAKMGARYGQAESRWATAATQGLEAKAARWDRACSRRYSAMLRLVNALETLAAR